MCFEAFTVANASRHRTLPYACQRHAICSACDLKLFCMANDACPMCRQSRTDESRRSFSVADQVRHNEARAELQAQDAGRASGGSRVMAAIFFPRDNDTYELVADLVQAANDWDDEVQTAVTRVHSHALGDEATQAAVRALASVDTTSLREFEMLAGRMRSMRRVSRYD